jgi:hypothetical protein
MMARYTYLPGAKFYGARQFELSWTARNGTGAQNWATAPV